MLFRSYIPGKYSVSMEEVKKRSLQLFFVYKELLGLSPSLALPIPWSRSLYLQFSKSPLIDNRGVMEMCYVRKWCRNKNEWSILKMPSQETI